MKLILVRHAKAEDREKWGNKDDLKRPLTKRGIKQAKRIGKYIAKKYPDVDAIVSSLALRACDTAKYIVKRQSHSTFLLSPDINPEEALQGFLEHKEEFEEDWQTLVIVGHEPGISELVCSVCTKGALNLRIGKGCVVELERESEEKGWVLVGLRNF